jgi:hypothetical protein
VLYHLYSSKQIIILTTNIANNLTDRQISELSLLSNSISSRTMFHVNQVSPLLQVATYFARQAFATTVTGNRHSRHKWVFRIVVRNRRKGGGQCSEERYGDESETHDNGFFLGCLASVMDEWLSGLGSKERGILLGLYTWARNK